MESISERASASFTEPEDEIRYGKVQNKALSLALALEMRMPTKQTILCEKTNEAKTGPFRSTCAADAMLGCANAGGFGVCLSFRVFRGQKLGLHPCLEGLEPPTF
jgi:hypothetical protein